MIRKLLILTLFFSSAHVFAWGLTGHRIVGHIAMDHLRPEVKAHILKVLGGEDLAMVANWMDHIKSDAAYDSLSPWHYCTVANVEEMDRHEHPDEGDVWQAIEKLLLEIENEHYSVDEAFALRALAHLIGDVHQPLHCGNGLDKGGNDIKVVFFWEKSNLHRVWDSGIIDYFRLSYTEYASWVMRTRSEDEVEKWKNSGVADWVRESATYREQCYQFDDPDQLNYKYIYAHKDLLHLRLAQAGVRLADALNKAYESRM